MKASMLSGVIFLLMSAEAMAETISSGFYLSGRLGSSQFRNSENTASGQGTTVEALNWDMGKSRMENTSSTIFSPSIAVGYRFANDWQQPVRAEMTLQTFGKSGKEFSFIPSANGYWNGDARNHFSLPATADVSQKTRVNTLMFNAFYDFPLGNGIAPYLMTGVGAAFVQHNIATVSNVGGQVLEKGGYSSKKTNLAWAVGAGVAWDATENISVELGYIFTDAGGITTDWTAANGTIKGDGNVHSRVQLHSLHTGIRYHF